MSVLYREPELTDLATQLESLCTPDEVTELCALAQAELQNGDTWEWFEYLGNEERDLACVKRALEMAQVKAAIGELAEQQDAATEAILNRRDAKADQAIAEVFERLEGDQTKVRDAA